MNQPRSVDVPDEATRLLCASARLKPWFADYVLEAIVGRRFRAVAPPYGIDLVALVRHAAASRRGRDQRDVVLLVLLAVVLAVALVLLRGDGVTVSQGLVLLITVAGVGVLAWGAVFSELRRSQRAALDVYLAKDRDPRSQAPAVDGHLEQRLNELKRMNVVVYNRDEEYKFVGSGAWVETWHAPPLDVTRAATDDSGRKRPVRPFDVVELHGYVATTVRASDRDGLGVRNRLYVQGDFAREVVELFPGKALSPGRVRAPEPVVAPDVVKAHLLGTPSTKVRTHLCIEKIADGQQMAVTMFINAALDGNLLTVTTDSFYLPMLQRQFSEVRTLPVSRARMVAQALLDSALSVPATLVGSVRWMFLQPVWRLSRRRWERQAMKEILDRRTYDFGAVTRSSIRELAAVDLDSTKHQDHSDMERNLNVLRRRVLDAIERFLDDHGVDTSDFSKQKQSIVNTTYNFRDVHGKNIVFGPNGDIQDNSGKPPPGGQPADQGGQSGQR